MSVVRYPFANPWRELDHIAGRLSRVLDAEAAPFTPRNGGAWVPPVSVEESQDELLLVAELPGLTPSEVEIELENNVLSIRGERREEKRQEDEGRKYHLWERTSGSFQRSFTLPRTVTPEAITAEFDAGLLRIRMPKVNEGKSRRIEIAGPQATQRAMPQATQQATK